MRESVSGNGGQSAERGDRVPLHVAIVKSGSRICHLVADTSREGLTRQLAEYVRHAADYQLWPDDGARLARLLASGRLAEAVALYFARTGDRWGREELVVRPIHLSLGAGPGASEA